MSTIQNDIELSAFADRVDLSSDLQTRVISVLWPCSSHAAYDLFDFKAYFRFLQDVACPVSKTTHSIKTFRDLTDIMQCLNAHHNLNKGDMKTRLQARYPRFNDANKLDESIQVAASLAFFVTFRNFSGITTLQTELPWSDEQAIGEVLRKRFSNSAPGYHTTKIRFSKLLTAYSLQRIGGFRISWTNNLADHLNFKNEKIVYVFCQISALNRLVASDLQVNQVQSWMKKLKADLLISRDILPQDLLEETLRTIALLFPSADAKCNAWLRRHLKEGNIDPNLGSCFLEEDGRMVRHFTYWRDRLLLLEEALEQHEPENISQWWYDRRRKNQWYTFWVAVMVLLLTLVFGIIQTVTGIMQAWASMRTLELNNRR
jgi:hypothetical protein